MELAEAVRRRAIEIGFDLCGITSALMPTTLPQFHDWLDAGHAGEMGYLERRRDAYDHPEHVLPSVRSVILCGVCYDPERSHPVVENETASPVGRIARYARIAGDYHDSVKKMLRELAGVLHELQPGCQSRAVVDTAPLLERDAARQAGLGWFGKNTMLINKGRGSYFFLGAVLTSVELPPDEPHKTDHCGTCTRCLEVCPTDALIEPHQLDARRCISYLTIELRDRPIPRELRSGMQDWMFGCDLCQEVCPWNRHAPQPSKEAFQTQWSPSHAAEMLMLSEEEFREQYRKTPLSRPGRVGMARNAAIVLGNSGDAQFVPVLEQATWDSSPLVRGAAIWALGELVDAQSSRRLVELRQTETDSGVVEELDAIFASRI